MFRVAGPREFRRATDDVAHPIEHYVAVIRIGRIKSAGKQADRVRELRHIIRAERLIKIRPANDRRDGRQPGHLRAHDFKRLSTAARWAGHAKETVRCDRDGNIANRTGLHGEDHGLEIVDFVWSGERDEAIGIAEPARWARARRNRHWPNRRQSRQPHPRSSMRRIRA